MAEKLYQKIYDTLLADIRAGKYRNGDRLPTEHALMAAYGVSRVTARTALQKLEAEGLVRRRRKSGTFVQAAGIGMELALVLPYNSVFNYDIIRGAQNHGLSLGCTVPFYNSFNDPKKEREILGRLLASPPGGILLYPCSRFENIDLVSRLTLARVPLVFVDREIPGPTAPLVTSDNCLGAQTLVSRLIARGYRKIAYYGVHNRMLSTERDRFTGYCAALAEHGIPVRRTLLYPIPPALLDDYVYGGAEDEPALTAAAREQLSRLISKRSLPEAVCCTNDSVAAGLLRAARELEIRVPGELAVTGFDNLRSAEQLQLTTAGQNFFELGRTALDCLYRAAQGEPVAARISVATELFSRASAPI